MIVIIGGLKKGTGKTTIAVNLAVNQAEKNKRTAILDCEPNEGAMQWFSKRQKAYAENPDPEEITRNVDVIRSTGEIYRELLELCQFFDHIIVDVGPENEIGLEIAMFYADKLYMPIDTGRATSEMNMDSLEFLLDSAEDQNPKLKLYAFANCSVFGKKFEETRIMQTISKVSCYNYLKCDWPITEHFFIKQSFDRGLGVNEHPLFSELPFDEAGEICREFEMLGNHVFDEWPFMYPERRFLPEPSEDFWI